MRPLLSAAVVLFVSALSAAEAPDPLTVAGQLDRLLDRHFESLGVTLAPPCSDEDFLRRAAFDLAGKPPKPEGVQKFLASTESDKRSKAIDVYLSGDAWTSNWASYWREVIFSHATNTKAAAAAAPVFEAWLAGRLSEGTGWDEIATDLLTATGDIRQNGATALVAAHDANAEELAGEVSRIFLGVQIQCADCHDHPTDTWKRQDFHSLAAFFPRVRIRAVPMAVPPSFEVVSFDRESTAGQAAFKRNPETIFRRIDRDGDGKATKEEVRDGGFGKKFAQAFFIADKDGDGTLSLQEFKDIRARNNENRRTEWFMPDLANPSSPGELVRPLFFLDGTGVNVGTEDLVRRGVLAEAITDPGNVWFARAAVNRVWTELVGAGFYTPVDDLGPERKPHCAAVLDLLSDGFVKSGYDLKWLLKAVANTRAYQRGLRTETLVSTATDVPFAAATLSRLRADHVYAALLQVTREPKFVGRSLRPDVRDETEEDRDDDMMAMSPAVGGPEFRERGPRRKIHELFGFDPSTLPTDVSGDVSQALFLMNSQIVAGRLRARGDTPLARIVVDAASPDEAIERLYLLALSRRPTPDEATFCADYVRNAPKQRDAYEDLLWALVNSTEFVTKR